MPIVRIRPGCTYRRSGAVGAGEEIEVTEEEVQAFGDKFIVLPDPEPDPPPPPPPSPPPPELELTSEPANPRYKRAWGEAPFEKLYALKVEEVETERAAPDMHVTVTERRPDEPFLSEANATIAARRLAYEHDVNLALIEGTGKDGRVVLGDVREALRGDAEQ